MAENKTLLDQWRGIAYNEQTDKNELQKLWIDYFQKEKEIYQQLLVNPDEEVKGTVKELAEKYNVDIMTMTGFLDGINDSLKATNPIEEMDENTVVSLGFDKKLLYKIWWLQKLTGCIISKSGMKFLTRKQRNHFTKNKSPQQQLLRKQKFIPMIHAHVEVEKNTKNVVEKNNFCF